MSITIPVECFRQIPFMDTSGWTPSRYVSCLTFYVKGNWHMFHWSGQQFIELRGEPLQADYFGDVPERPTDQCFRLFHLTAQKASFSGMQLASRGIWNDFQNLATALAKINLFFEVSENRKRETARFVETEIEYMVGVCKSVFDLLQEMIAAHWDKIELHDKSVTKKKLPERFSKVLFESGELRSAEEICKRYGLPMAFARWYLQVEPFFSIVRSLRNKLIHSGESSVKMLFVTKRGFAIHRAEKPWCDLYEWSKEAELPNELVPIRPALCAMVGNIIRVTESFAQILEATIELPAELFPGLKYFSRGFYDNFFVEVADVVKGCWWDDTHRDLVAVSDSISSNLRDE